MPSGIYKRKPEDLKKTYPQTLLKTNVQYDTIEI